MSATNLVDPATITPPTSSPAGTSSDVGLSSPHPSTFGITEAVSATVELPAEVTTGVQIATATAVEVDAVQVVTGRPPPADILPQAGTPQVSSPRQPVGKDKPEPVQLPVVEPLGDAPSDISSPQTRNNTALDRTAALSATMLGTNKVEVDPETRMATVQIAPSQASATVDTALPVTSQVTQPLPTGPATVNPTPTPYTRIADTRIAPLHAPTRLTSSERPPAPDAQGFLPSLTSNSTSRGASRRPSTTSTSSSLILAISSTEGQSEVETATGDVFLSQGTTRTIWDLTGSATSLPGDVILRVSSELSSGESQTSDASWMAAEAVVASRTAEPSLVSQTIIPTASPPTKAVTSTALPSPGSPEESDVRAVVSESITLSGSEAISAIRSGATRLPNAAGYTTVEMRQGPTLGPSAIGGIVSGGVLVLIVLGAVWYRLVKKRRALRSDKVAIGEPPNTGFDFTDDPVTASTGHLRPETMWLNNEKPSFRDPFEDRQSERQSWYHADDQLYHSEVHKTRIPTPHQNSHSIETFDFNEAPAASLPRRSDPGHNPFAPRIPISRSLSHPADARAKSATREDLNRPPTHFTDIYGAYESRPATEYPAGPTRRDEEHHHDMPAQTPATSTLLPWLQSRSLSHDRISVDAPPLPVPVPYRPPQMAERAHSPPRRPARPVMAQTPAGVGANEFNVMIPGFR